MRYSVTFIKQRGNKMIKRSFLGIYLVLLFSYPFETLANLAQTVAKIKPAIVGVGLYTPTGRPQSVLLGSGFVIGNGQYVVTNFHVIPKDLDPEKLQKIAVFIGSGKAAQIVFAKLEASDEYHDLAVLKLQSKRLPALTLAEDNFYHEGSYVAFTGFPIGAVLGLYPVTHRGIIASITPVIVPVADARQINLTMLKRLRDPYMVYQLDATAYPGNSGSALYDIESGKVIGIINKVFVQASKEAVIERPSGITYAIPVKHLRTLLAKHNITY